MAIIVDNISQGTTEWDNLRAGNPGASSISKIITNKGERSKQRDDYMRQLAGELITGHCEETFKSIHMENGLLREESARSSFELIKDVEIRKVALVYKDEQRKFHVSPDGLIGDYAGIEIKNPMMKTHVKYLLDKKLPSDYFSQIQMSLYTCELDLYYFMSCYAGLPPLILEIRRDEDFIGKLKVELEKFCLSLAMITKELREL